MRLSSNLSIRTHMIENYKAVVRWKEKGVITAREEFKEIQYAIERYKQLSKNPQVHKLSIIY